MVRNGTLFNANFCLRNKEMETESETLASKGEKYQREGLPWETINTTMFETCADKKKT